MIGERFAPLFPPDFVVVDAPPEPGLERLWPEERGAVEGAVVARQAEYATARWLCREAMRRLGVEARAVPSSSERMPCWPQGLVGSIAHTRGLCVAVLGRASRWAAVGIDVEPDEPVNETLHARLCRADEQPSVTLWGEEPAARGRAVRLLFCIKEAFYKCQYPCTRTFLGFQDARVAVHLDGRFELELLRDAGPWRAGRRLAGRWSRQEGYLAAGIALARSEEGSP
ncbi:MAG: 4'-phosphopantetheinyl transferase superfamily protein [Myxococcota bacterium]|nr:4'-phosphopantetheinyl transferase superfamily protein [Myxococcota bacterium]MDW8363070.1 4'-phosphopantetheinyl transferase superfamily protein [Myxococcales bacterium]